jgi:transmembrane sensor
MQAADARILDEAARWLARRHASDFSAAEQAEVARWRSQSSRHEHIWQCAEQLKGRLGTVPAAVGMATLNRARPSAARRGLLRCAVLALATPALGWLAWRHLPWQDWTADYRTARGERRTVTLADGSRVQLNTASAISVRMDAGLRLVRQHAGEILVETAHAPPYASQPFVVQTEDGRMQALGTRFIVRKLEHRTALSVLEGAVRVTPASSATAVVVHAGEQLYFDGQGTGAIRPVAAQDAAWTQGVLHAENLRLRDFLAELSRYREGLLRCDDDVAELRVSGSYQLRDTDSILALLAQTLPVRVHERSRYWVTVSRR